MRRRRTVLSALALIAMMGTASCAAASRPSPAVAQVAAGGGHACALVNDGTVTCWGLNVYGELGTSINNGATTANPTPTPVPGLTHVTRLAAGGYHTCALINGGTVTCWGNNHYGQLGTTTNNGTDTANRTPTPVPGLTHATQFATGATHTCALIDDGTVSCWGSNGYGSLGTTTNNGTNTANPTPTPVPGLTHATQLATGEFHTCALIDDGTATCWGNNHYGQLGTTTNNGINTANPTPTPIAGLTHATQLTASSDGTCALIDDGTATCWGNNRYGQLGTTTNNGTDTANPTPTPVPGLTHATRLSSGYLHRCAGLDDGTATCWGSNADGELGTTTNNGTTTANPTPTPVPGLIHATQLALGYLYSCALTDHRTVTCWGNNHYGQLGTATNNGTDTANPTPTPVPGLP